MAEGYHRNGLTTGKKLAGKVSRYKTKARESILEECLAKHNRTISEECRNRKCGCGVKSNWRHVRKLSIVLMMKKN